MAQVRFEVTKELLDGYVAAGYTVETMAEKLTELASKKCSIGNVRKLCKFYKINLREKSTSFFVPTINSVSNQQSTNVEQITPEVHSNNSGVIESEVSKYVN